MTIFKLATLMKLKPSEAIALPAVLDKAAAVAETSRQAVIDKAICLPALRDYLGKVCKTVMERMNG